MMDFAYIELIAAAWMLFAYNFNITATTIAGLTLKMPLLIFSVALFFDAANRLGWV